MTTTTHGQAAGPRAARPAKRRGQADRQRWMSKMGVVAAGLVTGLDLAWGESVARDEGGRR